MDNTTFGGGWLFAFLIIAVMFFGGRLFGNGSDVQTAVDAAVNNQSTQQGLRDVLLSSANNNYETARLISQQNLELMQQNNTNLINVIQGFNAMNLSNANQFAEIRQQMSALGAQMNMCCCEIKTQMLQDRLDEAERLNVTYRGQIDNANQTQTILGTLGRWVANPPVAAAAATA